MFAAIRPAGLASTKMGRLKIADQHGLLDRMANAEPEASISLHVDDIGVTTIDRSTVCPCALACVVVH